MLYENQYNKKLWEEWPKLLMARIPFAISLQYITDKFIDNIIYSPDNKHSVILHEEEDTDYRSHVLSTNFGSLHLLSYPLDEQIFDIMIFNFGVYRKLCIIDRIKFYFQVGTIMKALNSIRVPLETLTKVKKYDKLRL